ncbi:MULTISPECIES: aminoacyl-tRNA deacylase [unclassified Wenzhouxiangella]|uniref:aminoacyl-tRNA deacylase n=1 Tax=unclassified Wenzhouxiangella TaxID=2613841 RepID=UPI000E3266FC|nr:MULTISPECIES: YbaK/EbsC family protein [unclassified Wenzhouxiangella]RFF26716.1 deacylase [Wenzhouxiangella sp. 15181]RFP69314.1 deacylase [Wenzhouxiangella sp. 15190]
MPAQQLRKYLEDNGIDYKLLEHDEAITAQEVAAAAHIPGRELAKTLIVKLDGDLAMVVLRATDRLDLDLLKSVAGAHTVELASEDEFKSHFPECETGAMPPFGNLYDMPVLADEGLADDETITFNAGSHTEAYSIAWKDFERFVEPRVARLRD